eukprot:71128-Chlamydomonas_euryale.AAC.1
MQQRVALATPGGCGGGGGGSSSDTGDSDGDGDISSGDGGPARISGVVASVKVRRRRAWNACRPAETLLRAARARLFGAVSPPPLFPSPFARTHENISSEQGPPLFPSPSARTHENVSSEQCSPTLPRSLCPHTCSHMLDGMHI